MTASLPKRLVTLPARLRQDWGLNISYVTLRTMAVDRLIPAFQVNHIWHYNQEDDQAITDAVKRRVGRYARVAA